MTLRTFFAINAVLAIGHGLGFILMPSFLLGLYQLAPAPGTMLMGQLFGAELLVVALIAWYGRALTDAVAGRPYGTMGVPGRDYGIQLLLDRDASGGSAGSPGATAGSAVLLVIPYRIVGTNSDGTDRVQGGIPFAVPAGKSVAAPGLDITVRLERVSAYTLLIAKQDPGAGIVWFAFLCLIAGIAIVFYRPRRRVWARLEPDGRLALAGRSDRYVDFEREFGRLLDDLVARRRPPAGADRSPDGP